MSCVTYHLSCVTCHVSHVTHHFSFFSFFWTKWWSLSVEGLLSTGPTPSSLLPTAVPVVCLSYCRPHSLEYHYDITVSDHTKCVIQHRHTFGILSHHGCLGSGGLRRKSPLDGATDFLSKIWQHIRTVLCQLSLLFAPGSPKTPLYVSKWGRNII